MPTQATRSASHANLERLGFRLGARGTHTSRTIMLKDVKELFAVVPTDAERDAYAQAVVSENVLAKPTAATRRLSLQRLRELYGLDPRIPVFRILRRLWDLDRPGRPRLALLAAMARDPLLAATALLVVGLREGAEMIRADLLAQLRETAGQRLSDSVLEATARNVASSWAQAGLLRGRVRKIRCPVEPTPGTAALAMWLGRLQGYSGSRLLESPWAQVCGESGEELLPFVLKANQLGLIRARAAAGILEVHPEILDPAAAEAPR